MKEFTISGKSVFLITTRELSKAASVSSRTLRRWQAVGVLPQPVAEEEVKHPVIGNYISKFYLTEQMEVLVWWMSVVKPRKWRVITEPMKNQLHEKWEEVTNKFLKNLEGVEM